MHGALGDIGTIFRGLAWTTPISFLGQPCQKLQTHRRVSGGSGSRRRRGRPRSSATRSVRDGGVFSKYSSLFSAACSRGGAAKDGAHIFSSRDQKRLVEAKEEAEKAKKQKRAAARARSRARSHFRFAPPRVRFIPDPLTYSVPLFLKQQCGRTPRAGPGRRAPRTA